MAIMTVNGPIHREELGVTSPHEHALIDIRNQYTGPASPDSHGWKDRVSPDDIEELIANPYAIRDNLVLDNAKAACEEIQLASDAGLCTFVDATPAGIGRSPTFLRRLSQKTGLHIVAGCGFYTVDAHPPRVRALSEEVLAAEMIGDLMRGIEGTDICAGLIGELGTSSVLHEAEKKVLRAAVLAHHATGAPLMVHLYPWGRNGIEVLDLLEAEGVAANRICMCHTDIPLDLPYMTELLRRGVFLEFDNFGKEFHINAPHGGFPSDQCRLQALYRLVDEGYADQLLASCDICLKVQYRSFGGKGYSHILEEISQLIRKEAEGETLLHKLLVVNPARYLDNPRLDGLFEFYQTRRKERMGHNGTNQNTPC